MNRYFKIGLGLATLWPIVYLFIFLYNFVYLKPNRDTFDRIYTIHMITTLWSLTLIIYYLLDCSRNKRVPRYKWSWWMITLLFFSIISMPLYWYWYIWPDKVTTQEAGQSAYS